MAAQRSYASSEISVLLHNQTNPREEEAEEELVWRKKRRLSAEQVQFLEKSFEVENKLEPERKIQLAEELGLHPRQVAIWFQNRRSRYQINQLQKQYSSLKTLYHDLQSDYEALLQEEEKLKTEVADLKQQLAIREKGKQIAEVGFEVEEEDKLSRTLLWSCYYDEPPSSCWNVVGFHIEDQDQAFHFWPC